jgi:ketosteroid isomerase-like protein
MDFAGPTRVGARDQGHSGSQNAAMADGSITDEELFELTKRTEEATSAFMRGDMNTYLALTPHAPGFMLMNPFGGEPTRYDDRSESLLKAAEYFRAGEAKVELVQTYASGDLVVLVMIERQHGEVGGLPDQEWPLRVTQVYRRAGAEWQLVYRHADPLVHHISLEQAAALARG